MIFLRVEAMEDIDFEVLVPQIIFSIKPEKFVSDPFVEYFKNMEQQDDEQDDGR